MKLLGLAMACAVAGTVASANEFAPVMRGYVEKEVMRWVADPVLVDAIRAQNRANADITDARIGDLDARWQAEVGAASQPTITAVLEKPASAFLRDRVKGSAGVIAEVFVMDAHGLNVATSGVTSDMWQGDEAKFQETFLMGAGAMHVGELEFDESTQSYLGQVSLSIADPDSGAVIGAISIGLNAEMLF